MKRFLLLILFTVAFLFFGASEIKASHQGSACAGHPDGDSCYTCQFGCGSMTYIGCTVQAGSCTKSGTCGCVSGQCKTWCTPDCGSSCGPDCKVRCTNCTNADTCSTCSSPPPTPPPPPPPLPAGCSCTSWVNGSCGGSGCAANEMSQSRTCSPAGCSATSQCVSWGSCSPPPPPGCAGAGGQCTNSNQCCAPYECNTTNGANVCQILSGQGGCARDVCRNRACVTIYENPDSNGNCRPGTCADDSYCQSIPAGNNCSITAPATVYDGDTIPVTMSVTGFGPFTCNVAPVNSPDFSGNCNYVRTTSGDCTTGSCTADGQSTGTGLCTIVADCWSSGPTETKCSTSVSMLERPAFFETSGGDVSAIGGEIINNPYTGHYVSSNKGSNRDAGVVLSVGTVDNGINGGLISEQGSSPGWKVANYNSKIPLSNVIPTPSAPLTAMWNKVLRNARITQTDFNTGCQSPGKNFVSNGFHFYCTDSVNTLEAVLSSGALDTSNKVVIAPHPNSGVTTDNIGPSGGGIQTLNLQPNLTAVVFTKGRVRIRENINLPASSTMVMVLGSADGGDLVARLDLDRMEGIYLYPGFFTSRSSTSNYVVLRGNGALLGTGGSAFSPGFIRKCTGGSCQNPTEIWTYNGRYLDRYKNVLDYPQFSWREVPPDWPNDTPYSPPNYGGGSTTTPPPPPPPTSCVVNGITLGSCSGCPVGYRQRIYNTTPPGCKAPDCTAIDPTCVAPPPPTPVSCTSITISPTNTRVNPGETRNLTANFTGGSGSQTFNWQVVGVQPAGAPQGSFNSTTTQSVNWTAPSSLSTTTTWTIQVTVNDTGNGSSSTCPGVNLSYVAPPPPPPCTWNWWRSNGTLPTGPVTNCLRRYYAGTNCSSLMLGYNTCSPCSATGSGMCAEMVGSQRTFSSFIATRSNRTCTSNCSITTPSGTCRNLTLSSIALWTSAPNLLTWQCR